MKKIILTTALILTGIMANAQNISKEEYAKTIDFPIGATNDAYAKYFVGQSYLAPINMDGIVISNVTFEPGCRNNWHGAAPNSWFSHLAFEVPGEKCSNEWLEPVNAEDYNKLK